MAAIAFAMATTVAMDWYPCNDTFVIVCFSFITDKYTLNRIRGTVVDIRPLKLQASLRARDLARYCELAGVGHRFGKVSVLATMPSQIYPGKLEWTSNADRLKLNGWFAKPNKRFIG